MASKVPPTLKGIANYVKIANENASRDPVVYYWCLFYAVQTAMQLDKKSPDALQFITSLLGTLEVVKKQLGGNDAVTNEIVGQAHLENFAWKLFNYADEKEKVGAVDKGVVHAFFTAGYVFDVLSLFGEIDEGIANAKKYAKWKCMQINKCITEGTQYIPSTAAQKTEQDEDDDLLRQLTSFGGGGAQPPAPSAFEQDYHNPPSRPAVPQDFNNQPRPPIPHHSNIPGNQSYGFHDTSYPPANPPSVPENYNIPAPIAQIPPKPASPAPSTSSAPAAPGAIKQPTMAEYTEARKYLKYAMSAIDFEDTKAVIDNVRKVLSLMED